MVEEKVLGTVPTPQSARFTGAIRTAPPRPEAERREIAERIRTLTATVDATQDTDIKRGRKRFENLCAGCHSIRNDGAGFGPSLSGSRNRTTEAILTAVLDPSQAVEGVFRPFQIETADGGTVEGFFGEETPDSLTLRFPGGRKEVVPLQSVKQAGYVDGRSVMPEGLLDGLDVRAVADLVRYLRSIP
jgi:putative heme-binding domain-containing protein